MQSFSLPGTLNDVGDGDDDDAPEMDQSTSSVVSCCKTTFLVSLLWTFFSSLFLFYTLALLLSL